MLKFIAGVAVGLLTLVCIDTARAVAWCPNPGACATLGCGVAPCACVMESETWQCQEPRSIGGGGGNP